MRRWTPELPEGRTQRPAMRWCVLPWPGAQDTHWQFGGGLLNCQGRRAAGGARADGSGREGGGGDEARAVMRATRSVHHRDREFGSSNLDKIAAPALHLEEDPPIPTARSNFPISPTIQNIPACDPKSDPKLRSNILRSKTSISK